VAPASLRLVDNEQFIMGQALKVKTPSYWKTLMDTVKKLYITQWKGFKQDQMCAATLVLEGTEEVRQLLISILSAAKRFLPYIF
jgi:alkyldihydroxyacetonephosphate synthase